MALQYTDIADMHAAGDDAATIFAALQADTRHVRDVMATSDDPDKTDLLDVLGEFGLLGITPQAEWTGPLVAAVANEGDATLTDGFNRLLMNLQITNRPVRCNSYASIGALVTALTALGAAALTAQGFTELAAGLQPAMDELTGGRIFADVTEAEIQSMMDSREAEAAALARAVDIQRAIDHFRAITQAERDAEFARRVAADAAISDLIVHENNAAASLADVDSLTDAELTARVDAVIATSDGVLA